MDSVRGLFLPDQPTRGLDREGAEIVRGDRTVPSTPAGVSQGVQCGFRPPARAADPGSMSLFQRTMVDDTASVPEELIDRADRLVHFSSIAPYCTGRHLKG